MPVEWMVPLMPMMAALPLAVAAVVIALIWRRRRDRPLEQLEAQNAELREELQAMRRGLAEAHERIDFTERLLTERGRTAGSDPPGGD